MPAVMITNRGWKSIDYDYLSIIPDCLVDKKNLRNGLKQSPEAQRGA